MKSFRHSLLLTALSLGFWISGCDKNGKTKVDFDRRAMLENYANNLIIPAYQNLKSRTDSLKSAADAFALNPGTAELDGLQNIFLNAYRSWQAAEVYELGPARDMLLRSSFNTFPTDTALIGSNVRSGSYDLEAAANFKAKGFPALDFLLFGVGANDAAILGFYTTDAYAANRLTYLNDIVNEMKTKTDSVLSVWLNGYVETFKNADGTDVGSSTSYLVNEFNYTWELTKNPRIGIPLGKKSLDVPLPEKAEAYYSGISVELATLNLQNIRRVLIAEPLNGAAQGPSLETYLDELGARYSGQLLSDAILGQFDLAIAKTALIPNPLSDAVVNYKTVVEEAYIEIQKAVVLIKTDMPSAMGILINYQDADGD